MLGPAVHARTLLAVVSASYHGEGCIRFGNDPCGYMADSGHVCKREPGEG